MSRKREGKGNSRPVVVVRKEEAAEGRHHGGAWKVAYADFVTAMMAFFLLMWLLNATTEEQRKGLADYFSNASVLSRQFSGSGRPFGGKTPYSEGAMVSDLGAPEIISGRSLPNPHAPDEDSDSGAADASAPAGAAVTGQDGELTRGTAVHGQQQADAAAARREEQGFAQAAQELREAVRNDPALADLAKQLAVDETPEGLRIQIMDEEKQPMFAFGSADPNERARLLLQKVAVVLQRMPEGISVGGYTDAAPYRGGDKSNWDLSTERANATRRLLVEAGLAEGRFRSVSGHADHDLLLPAEPLSAANRRIAITVLRAAPLPK